MSILRKIIKTGVVAGAAYAAAKIGQKYKEKDPNGTAENKADVLKEAANEFYQTTAAAVKEKAPAVMETLQEKAQEAVSFAKEKAPNATAKAEELFNKAAEAAPGVIDTVSEKAKEAYAFAKENAPEATAKAEELFGKAKEFVSSFDEQPVDGEVVEFEDAPKAPVEEESPAEEVKEEE